MSLYSPLPLLAVLIVASGCVFDNRGISSRRDGAVADRGLDGLDPDMLRDAPLVLCNKPPDENVCHFADPGDTIGQVGTCKDNAFNDKSPWVRRCHSVAPCEDGRCQPLCNDGCAASSSACGQGVCTVFFSGQIVRYCCVTALPDTKDATGSCTKNDECKSGLCNVEGNCHQPCTTSEGLSI